MNLIRIFTEELASALCSDWLSNQPQPNQTSVADFKVLSKYPGLSLIRRATFIQSGSMYFTGNPSIVKFDTEPSLIWRASCLKMMKHIKMTGAECQQSYLRASTLTRCSTVGSASSPTEPSRSSWATSRAGRTTSRSVCSAVASSRTLTTSGTIWGSTTWRRGRWCVGSVGRSPGLRTSSTSTGTMYTRWRKVSNYLVILHNENSLCSGEWTITR